MLVHQRRRHAHRKPIVGQEEPRLFQPPSFLSSATVSLHPFLFLLPSIPPCQIFACSSLQPAILPCAHSFLPPAILSPLLSSLSFLFFLSFYCISLIFCSLSLPHSFYPSIFFLDPNIYPSPPTILSLNLLTNSFPALFPFHPFCLSFPSRPPSSLTPHHPPPPSPTEACSKWQ